MQENIQLNMQMENDGIMEALVDAPLLKSGETGFDNLNATYIVMICTFDLFGYGKYRYTFENQCREVPGLSLGDDCRKVILNTAGTNDSEVEQSLVDFLHYVEKSSDENVPENCDERLKNLHKKVKTIKASRQIGVSYMKMEERDRLIREDGKREGRNEGEMLKLISLIQKKVLRGKNLEDAAAELEEDAESIRTIYCLVKENAEKSKEDILNLLDSRKLL